MQRRTGARAVLGVSLSLTVVLALFPAQANGFARPSSAPSGLVHPAAVPGQATVATDSPTATASFTALVSSSATGVVSPTVTTSETGSPTASSSPTVTASGSATVSPTPSPSASATATVSVSVTATLSPSVSTTATATISGTDSPTPGDTTVATGSPTPSPATSAAAASAYGQVPLQFEPNRGQTDARVAYLAHGPGYTVYLTASEAVLSVYPPAPQQQGSTLLQPDSLGSPGGLPLGPSGLALPSLVATAPITPSAVLHLSLVGANPQAAPVGQAQLAGEVNYLYGNDPSGWLTHIPTFAEVAYPNVYPGIDLVYHGRQQQLEYDFRLQPGADPNLVRLQVSGAQSVALDQHGNLALQAGGATLVQAQPTVYQEINGQRVLVDAHYTLLGGGQVGFNVASYDRGQPLVIDPVLTYSTYLGGTGDDDAAGIAVDTASSAYITGYSTSTNFPVAGGSPYQSQNGGGYDVFVSKLNAAGSALVYSTYLGGTGTELGYKLTVDSAGNAYVTGYTESVNFPTVNALQAHLAGTENAFVSKLNPAGSALVYSTYLGGSSYDAANGIAVDSGGDAYVAGGTESTNFPTVNPLQGHLAGAVNAFLAKLGTTSGTTPWHPHFKFQFAAGLGASVDLFDGHVDVGAADLSLPGRRLDLALGHTWDSTLAAANQVSSAGQGWSSDLTPSMTGSLTGTVTYQDAGGTAWLFPYTGSITATGVLTNYSAPPGSSAPRRIPARWPTP